MLHVEAAALKTLGEPKRGEIVRLVWSKEPAAAEIATYFPDVTRSVGPENPHLGTENAESEASV